jgi:fatty acid amide hydrolase
MLFPPHALPAFPHQLGLDLLPAASYAFLPNLLGLPAGVVSVTRVRPGEDNSRPSSRDRTIAAARQTDHGSVGLPVGVQVAARYGREDVVLALMQVIESRLPTTT